MSQDRLGLFDTPPSRRQARIGLSLVILFAAFLLVLPFSAVRLPALNLFVPMVDAAVVPSELIAAAMLFAQAAVFRSSALSVLGAVFLYTALLLIPHALTFPGAFSPTGLLGAGPDTTAWIVIFRQPSFPIAALLYVAFKQRDARVPAGTGRPAGVALAMVAAIALAGAVTVLTTYGQSLLPPYFSRRTPAMDIGAAALLVSILALYVVATAVLFRKRRSTLDMWLLVALCGFLVQILLMISVRGRFTASWYALYVLALVSQQVVTLALIAESNRLYARLALTLSAGNRERYARLMSLDAVAAAISHEVAQPLTAIRLQARSGRNRLTRAPPDVASAITTLDAIVDAEHRTSDVIKSIRAMFTQRPEGRTEFDLNELVRATVALMDWDLSAHHISLQLVLDEALPPVLADPVQIQRVLVNLVTNAIESLRARTGEPRRIIIRTEAPDARPVLLRVTDNGGGIAPDALERIFDAYFTTKADGVGIGLSLSRMIIEACGGQLWASSAGERGATLHLQLPRSDGS